MKKFKGNIILDDDCEYDDCRSFAMAKLRIKGVSNMKRKIGEDGSSITRFKATYKAALKLLNDIDLIDYISIKDFPAQNLINFSQFRQMKTIQPEEFNPMAHYQDDILKIGWEISIPTNVYAALYSQGKTALDDKLKHIGFYSAEFVSFKDDKITLFGYNSISELFPYMDIPSRFTKTYYLKEKKILNDMHKTHVRDYIELNTILDMNSSTNTNANAKLTNEFINAETSKIPEVLKYLYTISNPTDILAGTNESRFCKILQPTCNKLAGMQFPKRIRRLLVTDKSVELTYEDNEERIISFSSKKICPEITTPTKPTHLPIEHFVAYDILMSIVSLKELPF